MTEGKLVYVLLKADEHDKSGKSAAVKKKREALRKKEKPGQKASSPKKAKGKASSQAAPQKGGETTDPAAHGRASQVKNANISDIPDEGVGNISKENYPGREKIREFWHVDEKLIERKNLYVDRAKLSNTLADFADEDNLGRFPVVQQIKALTKQIAASYQDAPPPTQNSTPKTQDFPTDRVQALKKLHNTRSNMTKWKRKEANALDPTAKLKAEKKVGELTELKNQIEIFIKEEEAKVDGAGK